MASISRGLWTTPVARHVARPQLRPGKRFHTARNKFLKISEEVQDALARGKPVVALETTIYTHGFPYPENVALSSQLESLVRVNGGIPATIGILNGVARVGMEAEELIELVSSAGSKDTWKISRRDLGFISGLALAGRKFNGGTTIAGTMILAHLAGIKIFATGGLGGVHRGGENSMDISADLTELGRTPVAVISSGCKSFLDIPRTLEYLETQGVGVGTFADGREGSVDFPAFYSRDSGVKSPKVIQNEAEAAAIVFAQSRFPLQSGLHFANPVPAEAAMAREDIDVVIAEALRSADEKGIHGSDNTPYVLKKIKELSKGKSVAANRALITSNVVRGTKVAVELAKLELQEKGVLERPTSNIAPANPYQSLAEQHTSPHDIARASATVPQAEPVDVLVVGSLASDLICDYQPLDPSNTEISPTMYTSNPGITSQSVGGVGHNIALAAKYAGASVMLSSVISDDLTGQFLLDQLTRTGFRTDGIRKLEISQGFRTAQYVAINDRNRDLVMAVADMAILQDPSLDMQPAWDSLISSQKPKWVVVDGNWSPKLLSQIISIAKEHHAKVAFEPVSTQKSARIFDSEFKIITPDTAIPRRSINLATPNTYELEALYKTAREKELFEAPAWWHAINSFEMSSAGSRDKLVVMTNAGLVDRGIPQQTIQLLPYIPNLVVKLGKQGCLLAYLLPPGDPCLSDPDSAPYILSRTTSDKSTIGGVYMRLFPPAEVVRQEEIVSVNGIGDTMLGVLMAGLVREGARLEDLIPTAQLAAVRTLKSAAAVSPDVKGLRSLLGGGAANS